MTRRISAWLRVGLVGMMLGAWLLAQVVYDLDAHQDITRAQEDGAEGVFQLAGAP